MCERQRQSMQARSSTHVSRVLEPTGVRSWAGRGRSGEKAIDGVNAPVLFYLSFLVYGRVYLSLTAIILCYHFRPHTLFELIHGFSILCFFSSFVSSHTHHPLPSKVESYQTLFFLVCFLVLFCYIVFYGFSVWERYQRRHEREGNSQAHAHQCHSCGSVSVGSM